jgi:hypothetical protein
MSSRLRKAPGGWILIAARVRDTLGTDASGG